MIEEIQGNQLEQWISQYEKDPGFRAEGEATEVIERAVALLEEKGWSRSRLAKAMGVHRAYVSSLFNAPPNFTFTSLFKLGMALGVTPRVILDSENYIVRLLKDTMDSEELLTDIAIQRASRTLPATSDSTYQMPEGGMTNAAA